MNRWLVGWMDNINEYTDTIHGKFLVGMFKMQVKIQDMEKRKMLSLFQEWVFKIHGNEFNKQREKSIRKRDTRTYVLWIEKIQLKIKEEYSEQGRRHWIPKQIT